jgi:hypothetical protein
MTVRAYDRARAGLFECESQLAGGQLADLLAVACYALSLWSGVEDAVELSRAVSVCLR